MGLGMRELLIILLVLLAFWPWGLILKKAGYSWLWVLLIVVPLVNYIMLWVFALSDWPALKPGADQRR